jgi:hypothetical protein
LGDDGQDGVGEAANHLSRAMARPPPRVIGGKFAAIAATLRVDDRGRRARCREPSTRFQAVPAAIQLSARAGDLRSQKG